MSLENIYVRSVKSVFIFIEKYMFKITQNPDKARREKTRQDKTRQHLGKVSRGFEK